MDMGLKVVIFKSNFVKAHVRVRRRTRVGGIFFLIRGQFQPFHETITDNCEVWLETFLRSQRDLWKKCWRKGAVTTKSFFRAQKTRLGVTRIPLYPIPIRLFIGLAWENKFYENNCKQSIHTKKNIIIKAVSLLTSGLGRCRTKKCRLFVNVSS